MFRPLLIPSTLLAGCDKFVLVLKKTAQGLFCHFKFFVGWHDEYLYVTDGRMNGKATLLLDGVLFSIEANTEMIEIGAHPGTDLRGVLSDPRREHDCVDSWEHRSISADIFLDSVRVHLHCQRGLLVAVVR